MNNEHDEKKKKLGYEKPRLRAIDLAAEEVLAIGCKTTTGFASNGTTPPCMVQNCAKNGS